MTEESAKYRTTEPERGSDNEGRGPIFGANPYRRSGVRVFFDRLLRDKVDFMMLVLMFAFVLQNLISDEKMNFTLFLGVTFLWGLRLILWHAILWEKVDKYTTSNEIRRNIFGLGSYDLTSNESPFPPRPLRDVIIDIAMQVIIIAFVAYIAIQIIFLT